MVGDPDRTLPASAAGELATLVVGWYATHGRHLVIREVRDPYAIWLAETMSQQTQIGRVGMALPAFLARFPTLEALADATTDALLRAWGDLGYPRRALALRAAAREMVARHGGRVPRTVRELEALPGIGPYTARAVAATAYGVPVTALDVNARRVLGRVLGVAAGRTTTRAFGTLADGLAPAHAAAAWNHGSMDLGAMICRPRPDCPTCPLRDVCRSVDTVDITARSRAPQPAFRDTERYVRGRVLAQLRAAPNGEWTPLDELAPAIDAERVRRAVGGLARDRLLELDMCARVRLPVT